MLPNHKIVLIAAVDRNGAIGSQGTLPWHCPEDLRHFRNLTMGKVVLMGRKTADSLHKPLRDRVNLVLTRSGQYPRAGFIACKDMHAVRRALGQHGQRELWVIGGGELYRRFIKHAHVVHLTQLQVTVPDPDTWFPMAGLKTMRGCVSQSSKDPNVVFWTFTRVPVGTGRNRAGLCIEMDLNTVAAIWVPPSLR